MMIFYILNGKEIVGTHDRKLWAQFFQDFEKRKVAHDKLNNNVEVSTVFLGIDHGFFSPTPILFETMIFGGKFDGYQERYKTYKEAEEGHKKVLQLVRETYEKV